MLSPIVLVLLALSAACAAQPSYCCIFLNPQGGYLGDFAMCMTSGCGGNGMIRSYIQGFYMVEDCATCTANLTARATTAGTALAASAGALPAGGSAATLLAAGFGDATAEPFCCVNYVGNGVVSTFVETGGCTNANITSFWSFAQNTTTCAALEPAPATPLYCCVYIPLGSSPLNDYTVKAALVSTGGCPQSAALNALCGGVGAPRSCTFNSFFEIASPAECVVTPNCALYNNDCQSCTQIVGCGFCFGDNTCRAGNDSAPATGTCSTKNSDNEEVSLWGYGLNSCAMGPCPGGFMVDPCSQCLTVPGCGYCSGTVSVPNTQCLWGAAAGPTYATCKAPANPRVNMTYNPWFFGGGPEMCPENVCPTRSTCGECTADGMCNACWNLQQNVTCQPFDANACLNYNDGYGPMALTQEDCAVATTCRAVTDCYECFNVLPAMNCGWCDPQGGCWSPGSLLGNCQLLCPTNMTCGWPANHPYEGCAGPSGELTAPPPPPPKGHGGVIAGAVVGSIVFLGVVGGLVVYFRSRRPDARERAPLVGRS